MGEPSNATDVRSIVERVCAENKLGPFAANIVEQWIRDEPTNWPSCCGGGCDPCNGKLRAAARRVLRILDEG